MQLIADLAFASVLNGFRTYSSYCNPKVFIELRRTWDYGVVHSIV